MADLLIPKGAPSLGGDFADPAELTNLLIFIGIDPSEGAWLIC